MPISHETLVWLFSKDTNVIPLFVGLLSFFAVMLGFYATRRAQLVADDRKARQATHSARAIAYAQLARIIATTDQQMKFIVGPDQMIWLNIHRTLFPSVSNLERIEPLTPTEVQAVTSFYYLYQEQISFLTGSALEAFPEALQLQMGARFCNDVDVIGFNYSKTERKETLVKRLWIILRAADLAVGAISAAAHASSDSDALRELIALDIERSTALRSRLGAKVAEADGRPDPTSAVE